MSVNPGTGTVGRKAQLLLIRLTSVHHRAGMNYADLELDMQLDLKTERNMTPIKIAGAACAAALSASLLANPALAQGTKVAIGISGWTGFAPLTLAKEAGIFAKNGLDVTIKKIPQASRHLAIASGDIQCAATTVETWIVWNANGVAMTYEPYLSAVREKPEAGKIIATTLDYPMVMDTFGCTPKFIAENDAAVKALV